MWVYFSPVLSDVLIHDLTCNRASKISKISIEKLSQELRPRSTSKLSCQAKSLQSCLTLVTLWTVACQAPLSMMSSKQEYWSEQSFPSLRDLLNPGIKAVSPALAEDSPPLGPREAQTQQHFSLKTCLSVLHPGSGDTSHFSTLVRVVCRSR